MREKITYRSGYGYDPVARASDFFEGWPNPPSEATFQAALRGSYAVEFAIAGEDRVVGFVNALSDGVAAAFIPWLEVVPEYRGRGIGAKLMRRMLDRLGHLYSVDLLCDEPLVPYYRRFGLMPIPGMGLRTPRNLSSTTD
ncbi:GNAT family N-acetyltransferase [Planosporangium flavigriseum]|uniref:N-acetyltransferase n=1 Tax=Planosporangium flavigriseum TaxID=373681 RepID=A0A8J3LVN7_9ACTN|nr:GNAT family N-acetyltransferase [Planosporangium flavigriseum]GIG74436.1 N-acetyltransferase [Planosporangium flavigriseum]